MSLVHRPMARGFQLRVAYEHPHREYPLYHGPALAPERAHPFFPGTVIYVDAKGWPVR